jgi:hypothetical protein
MMTEVASDHLRRLSNIDRLPVCAGYNFELCIRHLQGHEPSLESDALLAVEDLKTLVGKFRERWPIQESFWDPPS